MENHQANRAQRMVVAAHFRTAGKFYRIVDARFRPLARDRGLGKKTAGMIYWKYGNMGEIWGQIWGQTKYGDRREVSSKYGKYGDEIWGQTGSFLVLLSERIRNYRKRSASPKFSMLKCCSNVRINNRPENCALGIDFSRDQYFGGDLCPRSATIPTLGEIKTSTA